MCTCARNVSIPSPPHPTPLWSPANGNDHGYIYIYTAAKNKHILGIKDTQLAEPRPPNFHPCSWLEKATNLVLLREFGTMRFLKNLQRFWKTLVKVFPRRGCNYLDPGIDSLLLTSWLPERRSPSNMDAANENECTWKWTQWGVHEWIQEKYNTPLAHTPGNPPGQLWKESHEIACW